MQRTKVKRDFMIVALLVLAGYPVSYALRRVFPPS